MNYIYDILLNFNNTFYEFYDWNKEDKLTHIRKIPIFRVSDNLLKDVIYNEVTFDKELINKVKDKTEIFTKDMIDTLNYTCLLCNDKKVIAIKCNYNGKVIAKSDLLIDEHNEIISVIDRYNEFNINYKVDNYITNNEFKTRKKIKMEKYIDKNLENQSTSKLEYILYECTNENCNNRKIILEKLKQNLENDNIVKIFNLIKQLSNQKKV